MDPNADITGFWLAWRKTCSIRRCLDQDILNRECRQIPEVMADVGKVMKDAHDVIATTNKYFADMIRSPRTVKALKRFARRMGETEDEMQAEKRADEIGIPSREDGESRQDDTRAVYSHFEGAPSLGDVAEPTDDAINPRQGAYGDVKAHFGRGKMISEYRDLVTAWAHHDEGVTNAFELVEIDLYREAAEKTPEKARNAAAEPMFNGKKLKDYLFEDICAQTGNICKSLWGYLLKKDWTQNGISRLRMVANASFRNPVEEHRNSGKDGAEATTERPDPNSQTPDDETHLSQAGSALRDYWRKCWDAYDVSDRVALCCAFFEYTMTDPFVVGLVPVKTSAFNMRKQKRVGETFRQLKDRGFAFDDVRELFRRGEGQRLLREIALSGQTRDPVCETLIRHFDEVARGSGN